MKVAGISDIHDSMVNLARLINNINSRSDIEIVINCGDLLGRAVIEKLAELKKEQYVVFSGLDERGDGLAGACLKAGITCFYDHGEVNAAGKRIGFTHTNSDAKMMNGFDVVFYGHLHDYRIENIRGCLFVCCGEILGRRISPCYVVYDTQTGEVEKVVI